jgi:hypothetical protein
MAPHVPHNCMRFETNGGEDVGVGHVCYIVKRQVDTSESEGQTVPTASSFSSEDWGIVFLWC